VTPTPPLLDVPPGLEAQRALGPDWGEWLDRLPRRYAEVVGDWELVPDGLPWHGFCSVVVPVRTPGGAPAALKIGFDGDDEGEHEHLALTQWGGRGAVRLLRADPHRRALLLERLHREDLTDLWDVEACEVVAGLYPLLHLPAPPTLRTVTSYVERWAAALGEMPRNAPVPRRLVEQATSLARDLVADTASTGVIVHGDLHYENVLAADRAPWLAIDPKPMSGDPHFEPAPMLWNRMEELVGPRSGQSLRDGLRRRFHTLVDVAGLDEHRARDWVVLRMVLNAHWSVQDAQRAGRDLSRQERDWITRCIAIAKAVQD
jgi:streptomycin 6-kinase